VILVVTDPPDPLADIARECAKHERVLSTGAFLDSLRFRVHLAPLAWFGNASYPSVAAESEYRLAQSSRSPIADRTSKRIRSVPSSS
jgi:malate/lactate dehydrogenase